MCRIRRYGVVDTVTVDCTRHTPYSMLTLCRVSTKICREPQAVAICVQILPPRAFFIGYRKLQCSLRAPLRCIRPSPEVSIALSLGGFSFFFSGPSGVCHRLIRDGCHYMCTFLLFPLFLSYKKPIATELGLQSATLSCGHFDSSLLPHSVELTLPTLSANS